MSDTILICGAGVDKSKGLNFPLASELVPKIRTYLKTEEGQKVDQALRKILPGLRFSYDKFIKNAIDKLSNEFRTQVSTIIENINKELKKEDIQDSNQKLGKLILSLLTKIQKLQEDVRLDEETEELIKSVFGDEIGNIDDENIIELPKLTFSEVFNTVMRKIFERSLEESHNPILRHIRGNLMDLEQLLMNNFIGFYTENLSQIKNYMYLSWTLWAYLKSLENNILNNNSTKELPFYSSIPNDWNIITLNYTSFSGLRFPNTLYFHGNLSTFVRMKDRQLCNIDNHTSIKPHEFIEDIVGENTTLQKNNKPLCVIPAIIPPLKMKPLLSDNFIEIWYNAKQAITNAERIIVVGYSFSYADEHFNDIIRKNKQKQILIINPSINTLMENLENIFSYKKTDYVVNTIQQQKSYSKDNLTIIKATATDINLQSI